MNGSEAIHSVLESAKVDNFLRKNGENVRERDKMQRDIFDINFQYKELPELQTAVGDSRGIDSHAYSRRRLLDSELKRSRIYECTNFKHGLQAYHRIFRNQTQRTHLRTVTLLKARLGIFRFPWRRWQLRC